MALIGGFPKDLVQRCLSSSVANNDATHGNDIDHDHDHDDPGSSLQLVLSVLVDKRGEPDSSEWKALLDVLKQQQGIGATAVTNKDRLPTLISGVIFHTNPQDTRDSIATFSTRQQQQQQLLPSVAGTFYLGFLLISLLLRDPKATPFEVHSVAVQSLVLDLDYSNSQHQPQPQQAVFVYLCLLLCNWSLEHCQREIQEQIKNKQQRIRWKRIKSLILETLRLYQSHALTTTTDNDGQDEWGSDDDDLIMHNNNNNNNKHGNTTDFVCLWTEFLLPQCQALWRLLPDTVVSPSTIFFQTVTVSISSHLAVQQHEYESTQQQQQQQSNQEVELVVEELYQSLKSLEDLPLEQIWCHPWRVANFLLRQNQQKDDQIIPISRPAEVRHESWDWWTLEREQEEVGAIEDDDSNDREEPFDEYENIKTSWNEAGVALLAWQGWKDSSRPMVYRMDYESQLWLPQINVLMNPEQHPTSVDMTLSLTVLGIRWLQMLLPMLPTHALSLPTSFSLADPDMVTSVSPSTDTLSRNEMPPNHPVWTIQLLFNAIMSSVSSSKNASALPSSMELFTLSKALLSKCKPTCQMDVVFHHLLPTCPHPGLKPKIMDLLRPLLPLLSEKNNSDADRLWQSLEEVVRELGKYAYYPDSKFEEGTEVLRLQHVEELIDLVEYFISACTMIQLGWNIIVNSGKKRNHPSSIALVKTTSQSTNDDAAFSFAPVTLKDFHKALQTQLELWDGNVASDYDAPPPSQFFRLNLLENLLLQLIEL